MSRRNFEDRCRVVLTMYRMMDKRGVIRGGYGTVASAAGVTERMARDAFKRLDESGELVKVKGGRRFTWIDAARGDTRVSPPLTQTPIVSSPQGDTNPPISVTLQTIRDSQKDAISDGVGHAPPPDGGALTERGDFDERIAEARRQSDEAIKSLDLSLLGVTDETGGSRHD